MKKIMENEYQYTIGGSLPSDSCSYVIRKADDEFYRTLKTGEFCSIFNSTQTGKSSLRVRTMERLTKEGFACGFVDLSSVGIVGVDTEKWYINIFHNLVKSFELACKFNFNWLEWWRSCDKELSPPQKLDKFIGEILLEKIDKKIVIFIDELDHVLNLDFETDGFFAWMQSCYNNRDVRSSYKRLTFALLGVASPSELIKDRQLVPFKIGRVIELNGFTLEESLPLARGLQNAAENPQIVLKEILNWTGGQPFLTQKLCSLVAQFTPYIVRGKESEAIEDIVKTTIIENWEFKDEPRHLRTIRDRLLYQDGQAKKRLELYQDILKDSPPAIAIEVESQSRAIAASANGKMQEELENVVDAWDLGYSGEDIVVAVVDDGIKVHPALIYETDGVTQRYREDLDR
ncbi:MAG: AAA-like domain-containing protein, partial [Cyanobacteria bacterium SBLK]|nr:AAA-like domain-containing protein [Cyanobacteria bacterium SBLK]